MTWQPSNTLQQQVVCGEGTSLVKAAHLHLVGGVGGVGGWGGTSTRLTYAGGAAVAVVMATAGTDQIANLFSPAKEESVVPVLVIVVLVCAHRQGLQGGTSGHLHSHTTNLPCQQRVF